MQTDSVLFFVFKIIIIKYKNNFRINMEDK